MELSTAYREEFERVETQQAAADASRAEAAQAVRDALGQTQGLPRELCDALKRLGLALTTSTYDQVEDELSASGQGSRS